MDATGTLTMSTGSSTSTVYQTSKLPKRSQKRSFNVVKQFVLQQRTLLVHKYSDGL